MRDENYTPFLKPAPRRRPTRERLWKVGSWSCELLDHGEFGVEAQILRDDELKIARRLESKMMAVQWAEFKRIELNGC